MTLATLCLVVAMNPLPGMTPAPSTPRVRAMTTPARDLLADATRRSATVERLLRALEAQRVFVFVETRVDPTVPTAHTALLTANDSGRYVHVVLNPALTWNRRIELLGHELQHALEIAVAADVHDGASLRRHFTVIGRALGVVTRHEQSFETDAARDVEREIRRDLRKRVASAPR
ncbi:MAG: hypothetical protein KAY59_03150 [Acidobacteria bacterium]|nr:hypothetical protein [Acidobacteriota bacterium]